MPSRRFFTSLPFTLALAFGLASCGDEPDRASQPGREVMADVAKALNGVTSYHIEGTQVDEDGRSRISGDVSNSGSMRFTLSIGRRRGHIVIHGDDTFMKANRAFWLGNEDRNRRKVARLLGGRWVKLPAASAGELTDSVDTLLPQTLAYCARADPGNPTNKGTRTLAGRPVVVLTDKGGGPGQAPGRLYVAASGPALPLRVVQTGPEAPGKPAEPDPLCDSDDDSTTKASDIRFSDFGKPLRIVPPRNVVDLAKLAAAVS